MKIKSFFLALMYILFFWVVIPLFLILLNTYLDLPVFNNLIYKVGGLLLFIIGFSIVLYCIKLFIEIGKGTPVPVDPPKQLVDKRLYRFTRNPIYIGDILIFLGYFLLFGHTLLFFYFLVSIPTLQFFIVYIEEPELKRRLGKKYIEYTKNVPRWFPKLN